MGGWGLLGPLFVGCSTLMVLLQNPCRCKQGKEVVEWVVPLQNGGGGFSFEYSEPSLQVEN